MQPGIGFGRPFGRINLVFVLFLVERFPVHLIFYLNDLTKRYHGGDRLGQRELGQNISDKKRPRGPALAVEPVGQRVGL